MKVSWLER